jgi:hypothetical protein
VGQFEMAEVTYQAWRLFTIGGQFRRDDNLSRVAADGGSSRKRPQIAFHNHFDQPTQVQYSWIPAMGA